MPLLEVAAAGTATAAVAVEEKAPAPWEEAAHGIEDAADLRQEDGKASPATSAKAVRFMPAPPSEPEEAEVVHVEPAASLAETAPQRDEDEEGVARSQTTISGPEVAPQPTWESDPSVEAPPFPSDEVEEAELAPPFPSYEVEEAELAPPFPSDEVAEAELAQPFPLDETEEAELAPPFPSDEVAEAELAPEPSWGSEHTPKLEASADAADAPPPLWDSGHVSDPPAPAAAALARTEHHPTVRFMPGPPSASEYEESEETESAQSEAEESDSAPPTEEVTSTDDEEAPARMTPRAIVPAAPPRQLLLETPSPFAAKFTETSQFTETSPTTMASRGSKASRVVVPSQDILLAVKEQMGGCHRRKCVATIFSDASYPSAANSAFSDTADPEVHKLIEKLIAEAAGTFFLVLTMGVSVAGEHPFAPVAIGLALAVQIYTFAKVSGAMFNPAVTLAVLLSGRGKLCMEHALAFMASQVGGAMFAAFLAYAATGHTFCFEFHDDGSAGASFVLEVLFTSALCGTMLSTATSFDAPNDYFGFATGGTVTAAEVASAPSHRSLNPAVTLGINLANYLREGRTEDPSAGAWALYLLAPFLGSIVAAALFRLTRKREFKYIPPGVALDDLISLSEKLAAEFVGTFFLVLTVGLAFTNESMLAPVAVGLMLAAQIYTHGSVSGGVFNPAVALGIALSLRGKLSPLHCAAYVCAECLGALLAAFFALGSTSRSFCFDILEPKGSEGTSFLLEVLFTSALTSSMLSGSTCQEAPNQYFGFAVGGTLLAACYACGGFDLGSFNPAVTFGINLANHANPEADQPSFGAWMLFTFSPVLGACLSAAIFHGTRYGEVEGMNDEMSGRVDLLRGSTSASIKLAKE